MIDRHVRIILLLIAVAVSAGCESTLTAANVAKLQMGQTTPEQMKAVFGDPGSSGLLNSKTISCTWYQYQATQSHGPFRPIDFMSLIVELHDGRMSGYVYRSTRPDEVSRFDPAVVPQLRAGVSTREDVQALLGPPSGRVLPPSHIREVNQIVKPDTQEVWVYASAEDFTVGVFVRTNTRTACVSFDKQGHVQAYVVLQENPQS